MAKTNLTDKSVVVTGGASGIGLAIVKFFAAQNSKVSVLDISEASASSALTSLRAEFPLATIVFKKCDISSWEEQKQAFEQIYKETNSVDIVIANAGVSEKGNFLERDDGEPQKPNLTTLDVNLSGTLYTLKLAIHYMRKKTSTLKGSIVCTASNAGLYPFAVAPVYATSKHAVVGAVRSFARRLESEGIQINGLCPAVIGEFFPLQQVVRLNLIGDTETGLADSKLFSSMILTSVSIAVNAVEEFVTKPELSGIVAEISGNKFTFRDPPDFVDEDTKNNIETFWRLGYA